MEGGLHGPGEHDDDGRLGAGEHHEAFPDHECGRHDHAEGEHLVEELALVHALHVVEERPERLAEHGAGAVTVLALRVGFWRHSGAAVVFVVR